MTYYESSRDYERENLLTVRVAFNRKTESELVERMEREPRGSKATYLKRLVREDVEREKRKRRDDGEESAPRMA